MRVIRIEEEGDGINIIHGLSCVFEFGHLCRWDRTAGNFFNRQRINRPASLSHFKMQVRSRGQTGGSHISDQVTLLNFFPWANMLLMRDK